MVYKIIKNSFEDLFKNPILIVPSVLILVFSLILSFISGKVSLMLSNETATIITLWISLFTIVFILVSSYFYSGLIHISLLSMKRKVSLREMFQGANKFFIRNSVLVIIMLLLVYVTNLIIGELVNYLGKYFGFSTSLATIIFIILYYLFLVGIVSFLTFDSFFLIKNNSSIINSIKQSINFTLKNYISVLIILLLFLVTYFLVGLLDNLLALSITSPSALIYSIIIYPIFVLILARMINTLE
ncbi:MAG: hypothetical protein WCK29_00650 [archaeon]